MNKIVRVAIDDILFDPEEISEMLTDCLYRHRKMRLAGACGLRDVLIVSFEETSVRQDSRLVLAPFRGPGPDDISAEITQRYERGFSLRSSFRAGDRVWALFEVPADPED